ncbi:4740_t:CDS:2, partial [Gigaspora margarita]
KSKIETELNHIPEEDYNKIKENSFILEVYELITYWYGYYLNEGIGGDPNKKKASDLFKQAAVLGAQLHYAFSLLNEDKREEFIEYLTQVADNGNYKAQFHLGDLYLKGNVRFQVDEEKGKKYLKLAAKKGYKNAIALCKKNKITY